MFNGLKDLIKVFRRMFQVAEMPPEEMTEKDWEDYFIIAEAIHHSREVSEMRNRRNPYRKMELHKRRRRRY